MREASPKILGESLGPSPSFVKHHKIACQSSFKMSPFCVPIRPCFFLLCARSPFSSKMFAPGCPRNDDSYLGRPTASPVLLAGSGAQPCAARRAERLGRSGGQGQQRPRCHGPLGRSLLHHSPDCLSPRVIRWRYPLPFRARRVARSTTGFVSGTAGLIGAEISCQRSARPRYSMARLPCRPSHINTLPWAGA